MDNSQKVNSLDYLIVLTKWSRLIISAFLISCVLAFTIGSLVPKWYKATTVIFPPQVNLQNFGLSSFMQNLPFGGLGLLGESEEVLIYMAILKSRTVMEAIANKFALINLYNTPDMERTLRALGSNVEFNIEKEGTISISVLDKSPERAADMANSFVYYLDSLNTERRVETARNNRTYVEKRYNKAKDELTRSENALNDFQNEFGVLSLPAQIEEEIQSVSNLYSEIIATEIDLRVKEKNLSSGHASVIAARNRLEELNKKLDELQNSSFTDIETGVNGNYRSNDVFIPLDQLPDIGLKYARLYRDVQVQSKIYEMLTQIFEQAKIQEAKDTPTVQILDPAIAPILKAKPKRLIWMLLAGSMSLIVTIMYAFSIEYMKRKELENDVEIEKIRLIKSHLRNALRFGKRNK